MKANAPGGETTGQVGKAFKCSVFCVGYSMVTFPKLKESSAIRRQRSLQDSDGGAHFLTLSNRIMLNFQISHIGELQAVKSKNFI